MNTWIFQTNPAHFDIDGYLATFPNSMLWRAKRRTSEMQIGDRVYIWRSIGGGPKERAGLVAKATISGPVQHQDDHPATVPFWMDPSNAGPEPRVQITFDAIYDEPVLLWQTVRSDRVVGKYAQMTGTNFFLPCIEGTRFEELLVRAGEDSSHEPGVHLDPADDLDALRELWNSRGKGSGARGVPRSYRTTSRRYERDELVYRIALPRAGGVCELPHCKHPTFLTDGGVPFLEVHHIEFLAEGGSDTPENTAAICPSHHREAHFGKLAGDIASKLKAVRTAAP